MNFSGDLSRLIADLPQEEVDQAMEYYEDYSADAGPEKEQEIIRDFISPAYIAEQLREASLQRQKAAARSTVQEEEKQAAAARAAAAASKPPVYSRKLAAQAQKNASMATASGFVTQAPTVKAKTPAAQPAQAAPSPLLRFRRLRLHTNAGSIFHDYTSRSGTSCHHCICFTADQSGYTATIS